MDHKVEIRGRDFVPASITIKAGDTITWVNLDTASIHNATGIGSSVPRTGDLSPGDSSTPQTFPTKSDGEGIQYECTIHPGMLGRVVVTAAQGDPPPLPPPEDEVSDFEPEVWRNLAAAISAAWVYDIADDILNVLERHRVRDDDDRDFIRATFNYVQGEWDKVLDWWRTLLGDPEANFFNPEATIAERIQTLESHSRQRLDALGRTLRVARSQLAPLVERWPNPIRPDQVEAGPQGSLMFPGQSSSEFGKAITVNGLQKPLRDAYMDHQNFAGAAYGIELTGDLGQPVQLSAIRRYQQRKQLMNPLHYKFLALHQYSGLSRLSREENETLLDAFKRHMWAFCIAGEMDAPHFSWWHWLKFIDAHLVVVETGEVPDIVALPDQIADPPEDSAENAGE